MQRDCIVCTIDGCNYWYHQVPANKTCNLLEGGSAYINCDVEGICNTFSVLWFKHTNRGSTKMDSNEHIPQSNSKYQIQTLSMPINNSDGSCFVGTNLEIRNFNFSDNGYYWCQIISNNCLLGPSPRGYVAVGEEVTMSSHSCTINDNLISPMCAEDNTSLSLEKGRCLPLSSFITMTASAAAASHSIYPYHSTTGIFTSHVIEREDNMIWLYGLMTAFLLVIIILALSLVFVIVKHKAQQKRSKLKRILGINSIIIMHVFRIKQSL